MRWELHDSTSAAHVSFCTSLDRLRYEQMRALVLVYAAGIPDLLARTEAAKSLTDVQRVFIDIVDESTATSRQ
jgi:hypothetical protein